MKNLILISLFSVLLISCGDDGIDSSTLTGSGISLETQLSGLTAEVAGATSGQITATATSASSLSYQWAQTSGSPEATLVNATSPTVTVMYPASTTDTVLMLTVTVTNGSGAEETADASVTVPANGGAATCPDTVGNLEVTALLNPVSGNNNCSLAGVLSEDATLVTNTDWHLADSLEVGGVSETTSGTGVVTTVTFTAVLTVDAGANVRADGTEYVAINVGSSIIADGTAASPTVFSSSDADNNGTGEWGGLFLLGSVNSLLDHVVVAEAGAAVSVGGATRTDNIVLDGTDDTNILSFVQSHDSARDGFHIEDSSSRMAWLLATGATRDGVWYQNFNGVIKELMVIHRTATGRSGIYGARSSTATTSNPRIVNATLVGRDATAVDASDDSSARQFGILFADNFSDARYANIIIANFANGCYEVEPSGDVRGIGINPGPTYLDGVHCANEAGALPGVFEVVRADDSDTSELRGLPTTGVGNGDGLRYYNGTVNPVVFTGETTQRDFTAGWYLNSIGTMANTATGAVLLTNGDLVVDNATVLNRFNSGDTNNDGTLDAADQSSSFIINDTVAFNQDVGDAANPTGGYNLTDVGAIRGGAVSNVQFDGWTVETGAGEGFAVPLAE